MMTNPAFLMRILLYSMPMLVLSFCRTCMPPRKTQNSDAMAFNLKRSSSFSRLIVKGGESDQAWHESENVATDKKEEEIDPEDVDEWWDPGEAERAKQTDGMIATHIAASKKARAELEEKYGNNPELLKEDEEAHLARQIKTFDEMSDFFESDEATPDDVRPLLRQISRRALRTCIESRAEGRRSRGEEDAPVVEEEMTANDIKENIMYIGGENIKLIDVGCGTGALFEYYLESAEAYGVVLDIVAFDVSPKMVAGAERHAQDLLSSTKFAEKGHRIRIVNEDFVSSVMERSESGEQSEYFGKFDCVMINACFGNFFSSDNLMAAAASALELDGTVCISHPLGYEWVKKLHDDDPEVVPHPHPNIIEFRELIRYQALTPGEFIDSLDILDKNKQVVNKKFYFACAYRVSQRALRDVIRLRGPVASGYGRGGKKLGVPTANLPESMFASALKDVETGVYFGWAVIEDPTGKKRGRNKQHKAVVNVGYSPTFEGKENKEKIVEAHLIVDEGVIRAPKDFYNETMRLELIGSIRPEMKFPNFPRLVKAINSDIETASTALELQPFGALRADPFLVDAAKRINNTVILGEDIWVGDGGGDETASWEFEAITDAIMKTSLSKWVL